MAADLPTLKRNVIVKRIIAIAQKRATACVYLDHSNNHRLTPTTRRRFKREAASLLVQADELERLNNGG